MHGWGDLIERYARLFGHQSGPERIFHTEEKTRRLQRADADRKWHIQRQKKHVDEEQGPDECPPLEGGKIQSFATLRTMLDGSVSMSRRSVSRRKMDLLLLYGMSTIPRNTRLFPQNSDVSEAPQSSVEPGKITRHSTNLRVDTRCC